MNFCPPHVFSTRFVLFFFSFLFLSSSQAAASWSGASEEPTWRADLERYEIATPEQLAGMRDWVNSGLSADRTYALTADIDLGGIDWEPIGLSATRRFKGSFEGNGHVVANLSIIEKGQAHFGLFGNVDLGGGRIANLTLLNCGIKPRRSGTTALYVGTLLGYGRNLRIENCAVWGSIDLSHDGSVYVGGLVGQAANSGAIESSFAAVDIAAASTATVVAGGFAGYLNSDLKTACCVSLSDVRAIARKNARYASAARVGGFVGTLSGARITDSYASGNLSAQYEDPLSISEISAGGLIGEIVSESTKQALVSNSYTDCNVVSGEALAAFGGLIGKRVKEGGVNYPVALVSACRWRHVPGAADLGIANDEGAQKVDQLADARSLDVVAFADAASFPGWDFEETWAYTPLNRHSKPSLVDAARVSPRIYPDTIEISDGERRTVQILSTFGAPEKIYFNEEERLSVAGVSIFCDAASPGLVIVSADAYVTEAQEYVIFAMRIGDTTRYQTLDLRIAGNLEIATRELPAATLGAFYEVAIEAKNASGTCAFSVEGRLPNGVAFDADTRRISGTPAEAGIFDIALIARDARHTVSRAFSLVVAALEEEKGDGEDEGDENTDPGDENENGGNTNPEDGPDEPKPTDPDDEDEGKEEGNTDPEDGPDEPKPTDPDPDDEDEDKEEGNTDPEDGPDEPKPTDPDPDDEDEGKEEGNTDPEGGPDEPKPTDPDPDDEREEDKEPNALLPLVDLAAMLNESMQGIRVGLFERPDTSIGVDRPIRHVAPGESPFAAQTKPESDFEGHMPAAPSFVLSIPLNDETDGDALCLSYTVDPERILPNDEWQAMPQAGNERAERLDALALKAVYEYVSEPRERKGAPPFALLVGAGGLCSWVEATAHGIAKLNDTGISLHYIVVDGVGPPEIRDGAIRIPDGITDARIVDPIWLMRPSEPEDPDKGTPPAPEEPENPEPPTDSTEPDKPDESDNARGEHSGGCSGGNNASRPLAASLALLFLFFIVMVICGVNIEKNGELAPLDQDKDP